MSDSSKPLNQENSQAGMDLRSFKWPFEYMNKEVYKKGDTLFKAGDKADKMFYIKKGAIKLPEFNKVLGDGTVIGEMGLFSPSKERTASAVCVEDIESYTMTKDEVVKLFTRDSSLAINLIHLSFQRFIENLKRETEARERIKSELRIAQQIQVSMLPRIFPPFPDRKEFDIYATMDPAKEVGGDFYDFFLVDDEKLCFLIGDVSGKGVPAALFMAISKALFKTEALRGLPPDEVLFRVNNTLFPDNDNCMFVTVFCVLLDLKSGEILFSNGGHNPPLMYREGQAFDFLEIPKGFVVGAMEDTQCKCKSLTLKEGDIIFLYTDGVTEAMNPEKKMFSEERLKSCLNKLQGKDIKDIIHGVREDIRIFVEDAEQSDDITMLAVQFKGGGG